jgi:hypothetical protein
MRIHVERRGEHQHSRGDRRHVNFGSRPTISVLVCGIMEAGDDALNRKKKRRHHHHHHDDGSERSSRHHKHKHVHDESDSKHHKSHKKSNRHHKCTHSQRHMHESATTAIHGGAELFVAFVEAHPKSRGELRSLLALLDGGQAVILEQIPDTTVRARLRCALEALGLRPATSPDGSLAFAAPDNSCLSREYAELLRDVHSAGNSSDSDPGTAAHELTAVHVAASCHHSDPVLPKRVYGVALPPAADLVIPSLAPAAPHGVHDDGDENEVASLDSSAVGPPLPTGEEAACSSSDRWWKSTSKPAAAADADSGRAAPDSASRDGWMVSIPSGRGGLPTDQARQFLRRSREPVGECSAIWTETPAERLCKAAAAQDGESSFQPQPMTLAEAVAIASANAAAGKHPRAAFASQASGGGARSEQPGAKSLVEVHAEIKRSDAKSRSGNAEWEGQHPWKPWNRDTDLDVRAANPKGKESILNHVSAHFERTNPLPESCRRWIV